MRQPPPVRVCGRGGRGWRLLCAALPGSSVAVLLVWLQQQLATVDGATSTLVAAAAGSACALALWRRRPPEQTLEWDGGAWSVDGTPGRVEVMLDLGPWLLLRLRPEAAAGGHPGRLRWIPLAAREAGPHWAALRAAVYSRPSLDAQPATPSAALARRSPETPTD